MVSILFLTCFVPCVIAFGVFLVVGEFWGAFWIAFGVNFVVGKMANYILQNARDKRSEILYEKQMEILKNQSINVSCAYCSVPNEIPLSLSINKFTCDSCGKLNRLHIQYGAAQITTPVAPSQLLTPVEPEDNTGTW